VKILATLAIGITAATATYLPMTYTTSAINGLPAAVTDADYFNNGVESAERVDLGRFLFFDKILSGNENISCATCHHPDLATADAVSLPLGEGAIGLGTDRRTGDRIETAVHGRVPRNSPALFNLGATEFIRMMHDGRIETDPNNYYESGFVTPAKWKLPTGLERVLAAQAMFPPTSPTEMAGQKGENAVAEARSLNNAAGSGGVWERLGARLQNIPEYVDLFATAFPEEVRSPEDITMVLAANAIASYEAKAFRADESPFDHYLRDGQQLSAAASRGLELFYGKANCQSCHSGKFQTDHEFHAIAMPQIGPGKADGADPTYWRASGTMAFLDDFGRARETYRDDDMYKFRTPSLRNVALTGPWGHDGAYLSLEGVVRHHLNPVKALSVYDVTEAKLPDLGRVLELTADGPKFAQTWLNENRLEGFLLQDGWIQANEELRSNIAQANELEAIDLTNAEVSDLIAFLESLTDESSQDLSSEIPDRVPSGLPIDRR